MIRTTEDALKLNTEILERYFQSYKDLKKYIESATEADKQTLYYKHRKTIVDGIEEVYSTLTDEMKFIVQQRYWFTDYQGDWAEIADELNMTTNKVKRLRDVVIREFMIAIGWV